LNDIQYIPSVGPRRAAILQSELHVNSVEDLLRQYPYKYVDRSRIYKIREITEQDTYVQIVGYITSLTTIGTGRSARLSAILTDGDDEIELVWFKGIRFVKPKLHPNVKYLVYGKPTEFNHRYNITHPELEVWDRVNKELLKGLEPHYSTTEKMKGASLNSKAMRKIMENTLPFIQQGLPETLPNWILEYYHFPTLTSALRTVHFPKDIPSLNQARARLKFEELFYIQLHILRQMKKRELHNQGFVFSTVGKRFNDFFYHYLPYELTGAQKRVIHEIHENMCSGKQMNRLLQGDVGSGKTLVALMCALLANDNGFQACIMAPTEILAQQHFATLAQFLQIEDMEEGNYFLSPIANVGLLTGSTTKKQRDHLHLKLQSGDLQILIGTHALLEDDVRFANLGLVIIDEQHRFGVAQRAKLWEKNQQPPHILVMTATPIPRTLAMTVYGDLAVSVIDELPPGRKPIQTYHYSKLARPKVFNFMHQQIAAGHQVYVVYPLIKENEKMDLADLENGYKLIVDNFPECKVAIVHGKLKARDKDIEMARFAGGEARILVATTVIEVGVNVPNASVMVIENAERFGLSQLHQLRGRVGRGAEQSFCILLTNTELGSDTRKRMEIMVATNDGFRVAEADLQLRGPGDLEGTQQSGLPFDLKIASLATDGKMLSLARETAMAILDEDPELSLQKNDMLVRQLKKLKQQSVDWSDIS